MKTAKLFLVATNSGCFRPGEPAEVIGVTMSTPDDPPLSPPRPCFTILFKDGTQDSLPVFEDSTMTNKNPDYVLISQEDVNAGRIPKVCR